ncbi:MAG: ABC transporter substrate-binding protein, partial [Dehalococcoidia bacterium]
MGFIAFLTMSLLACQGVTTNENADIEATVATAVAAALAIQPSPAVPDPSAAIENVVEATIEVTDLGSEGDGPSVSPSPVVLPTSDPTPTSTLLPAPTVTPGPSPGGKQSVSTATPRTTSAVTIPPPTSSSFVPSGQATIAVNKVNEGVGTPRFCTAGCAEDIYVTSIVETLFRPEYGDTRSDVSEIGVLAVDWSLSPNLYWIDFSLREGVQFHDGWGEFTAEDIAFSFNEANRNTQPESIHGRNKDFAQLIKNVEVIDDYNVRMIYENFDSRGIRHRFSSFWQTTGITSKAVYDDKGAEGMRDFIIGTGPYKNLSWIQGDSIKLEAVPHHWRKTPAVAKITLLEAPEASARRAMLETGQVVMAHPAIADWNTLAAAGFEINLDSGHGNILNIGMTGNYWEDNRYYDGKALERLTHDKPWVSDTNSGDDYEAARLVRIGLAHAIDREALQDSYLDGWGDGPMYFAYQPPNAHPITLSHASYYVDSSKGGEGGAGGWEYPLDYDLAKEFVTDGGYRDGFNMSNVWAGDTSGLASRLMSAIGGIWAAELGVSVTINNSVFSTFRPSFIGRWASDPFVGCGDDANTSMPYD